MTALRNGRALANCAVVQAPKNVSQMLGVTNDRAYSREMAALQSVLRKCIAAAHRVKEADGDAFKFKANAFYGLLADAWFSTKGVPILPVALQSTAVLIDYSDESAAARVTARIATCLAYSQPGAVRNVLITSPESPAEAAAFSLLAPYLTSCLEKNVTLRERKANLRTALALATYKRTLPTSARLNAVAAGKN